MHKKSIVKKKLIAGGIPENEIAYIHSANTEKQKSSQTAAVLYLKAYLNRTQYG